ncbi:stalk domain-containing protein [Paenibacillus sp. MMS20-IR301]|uniref:stalk domain-containing protein n=1 Tax=Paenibacillus sp. MMS20-IR301 TaxID=2895946 RepID=UPI0028E7C956|nr:stalk domain-containing protein [Paenibacillus sp. MMS20-IR301]WNS45481.1 stalk domain-containing protein [Paenibacillus sp. MMS20-IR301]
MFNRIAAVFLCVFVLAAGTGLWGGSGASAAGSGLIIVNGQALQLENDGAYMNGPNVMVPLRESAEALKYKVAFAGTSGTFQLTRYQETAEFRLSGHELILNGGKDKVTYAGSVELKQKRAYVPLSLFAAMGLVTSYDSVSGQVGIYMPEVTAGVVAGLLAGGDYTALRERYFHDLSDAWLSLPVIQQSWAGVTGSAGNYLGVKSTEIRRLEGTMTIVSVLSFTKAEALLTLELDASGTISKLQLAPLQAAAVSAVR